MKDWRDLFYFSKSERRALTLLSFLILGAWFLLWFTEPEEESLPLTVIAPVTRIDSVPKSKPQDTIRSIPRTVPKSRSSYSEKRRFQKPFTSSSKRPRSQKFPAGTQVELNQADSLTLQKVPGIGPVFSRRIIKYRDLLGGFYTVHQLAEVYGIDADKYAALEPWFTVDTALIRPLIVNQADYRTLIRHPYLNKQQTKILLRLIERKGKLQGWEELRLLDEFPPGEIERLRYYLSFD